MCPLKTETEDVMVLLPKVFIEISYRSCWISFFVFFVFLMSETSSMTNITPGYECPYCRSYLVSTGLAMVRKCIWCTIRNRNEQSPCFVIAFERDRHVVGATHTRLIYPDRTELYRSEVLAPYRTGGLAQKVVLGHFDNGISTSVLCPLMENFSSVKSNNSVIVVNEQLVSIESVSFPFHTLPHCSPANNEFELVKLFVFISVSWHSLAELWSTKSTPTYCTVCTQRNLYVYKSLMKM